MTKAPWLTVVIPVFRAENSITQAISSVTHQGVDGIEIICIDDCSPDNSVEIITSIQQGNPAVRLLRHSANQGPGPARNSGIDAANGDYIVFLDSDDSLIDGGLRQLKETIQQKPDLVLLASEEIRRGKARSLTHGPLQESLAKTRLTNVSEEPKVLFWPPAPWSKAYRRQFLLDHGLRLRTGVAQDLPWSAEVTLVAESVSVCEAPFYRYVTGDKDSSITTTKSEKNLVRVAQVRAIREDNDVSSLSGKVGSHLSALAAIHLIWSNRAAYRLLPDDSHESFFHDSASELRAWLDLHPIPVDLDSSQLMQTVARIRDTEILLHGNWDLWQKHLARGARKKAIRRALRSVDPFRKK